MLDSAACYSTQEAGYTCHMSGVQCATLLASCTIPGLICFHFSQDPSVSAISLLTLGRCEASTRSVATCGANHTNSWQWGPEGRQCGAARQSSAQARYMLQQKWVVMAGDSITRFMFAALLRLLADDGMSLSITCLHCSRRSDLEELSLVSMSCIH